MWSDNEDGADHARFNNHRRRAKERTRQSFLTPLGPASAWPRSVRIFDPQELERELREDGSGSDPAERESATYEEGVRLAALRRLSADPRGPERRLLIGDPDMLGRVEELKATSPHFTPVIEVAARAVQLSAMTRTGLRLPPMLLLGSPGIGKTYLAKRLAAALSTSAHVIPMNAVTDAALLLGHPTSWKGAKQAEVTRVLVEADCASPVFLLDEVDKTLTHRDEPEPLNVLLTLLERENAARLRDEYLLIHFDVSHAVFLLTANATDTIPEPVLDRLLVFDVPRPSREQLLGIVRSIFADLAESLDGHIAEPEPAVIELLARRNPRRVRRILELALGFAAAENRRTLKAADVLAAERVASQGPKANPIGFALPAHADTDWD